MSKKRTSATQGHKKQVAAPVPAKRFPGSGDVTPWTYAVVGVAAFIAFALLFGWTAGALSLVVAPLLTGVFVALCLQSPWGSAAVAGTAGVFSAATSAAVYAMPGMATAAVTAPPDTNTDIPRMLYEIVGSFMAGNPVNSLPQPTGMLLLLGVGLIGTATVSWGTATLVRRLSGDAVRLRRYVAAGLVAVTCLSFVYTAISASKEMIPYADTEPTAGGYAFDAVVYLKTYYNMVDGQDYYTALVDAAAGDSRVMEDTATGIRDGKSYGGWLWGPSAMRRPTIFYVWKYLAPGGGGGIIYLAAILGAIALAMMWWGLTPYLSYRAAFVPMFAMPYVLFMTLGLNVFFPDYWTALLVVCSLALLMRRQWLAGAASFLLAAAIRETVGPALGVIAVALAVVWLRSDRGREWLARAGYFAGAAALWFGFEQVHSAIGARFMAVPFPSALELLLRLMQSRSYAEKVTRATQYLVFPYGFYQIPGLLTLLLAPLGYWTVLSSRRDVRTVVVAYTLFWIAFVFTVGATSSYWGQTIMLPSLVGVGALLMSADRMNARLEMTAPIA